MWTLALLILGLAGLWAGTELALRATVELAKRLDVSERFLGLTVLAVGTDLPELVVTVDGGIQQLRGIDTSGVVIGNAIGSAITQGSLVLGVAGLLGYLHIGGKVIRRDFFVLVMIAGILVLLGVDGELSRWDCGVLVLLYAVYWGVQARGEKLDTKIRGRRDTKWLRLMLPIVVGVVIVIFSAELVVGNAVEVATAWGMNQAVIGVILIGAGTSLPELALSLGAAAKGKASLSIGNIVGSNIFDLLIPIGASGLIHPIAVGIGTLAIDLPFLVLATVVAAVFFVWRKGLQRVEAGALVALYVAFAVVRIGVN